MHPPGSAAVPYDHLEQMLKHLDAVSADVKGNSELQRLADQVKSGVLKLQNVLKRTQVKQVAELVQAKEWDKATETMKQNFPAGGSTNIGNVEEVLTLVYVGDNLDNLMNAIFWVDKLQVQLKPRSFEAIYEQMKFKCHTDLPQVLMIWRRVLNLKAVGDLKIELERDCQRIVERIAEGIKKKDYKLHWKIFELDDCVEGELIVNEIMAQIVAKFDVTDLKQTLLLIQYCEKLSCIGNSCFFLDILLRKLESNNLLESENGLHLWALAKYMNEEEPYLKDEQKEFQKLCTDALDKLSKYKTNYLQFYQIYTENLNKNKCKQMHKKNCFLRSIVSEFVTWYYDKDDLSRVQKLILAVRATDFFVIQRVLTQLHLEMLRFGQINTNEAFCLFNEVKQLLLMKSLENEEQEITDALMELKSKTPKCLSLLLWPDEEKSRQQLRVVNKFFDSPLSIQQDQKLFCFNGGEDEEQMCTISVNPNTALTTFSFQFGDACWKLDASHLDSVARVALIGAPWKLKAVDEHHVKICTDDGKFLVAGETLLDDDNKRIVCLKRENNTDMQQWKLEPAKKKIRMENPDVELENLV